MDEAPEVPLHNFGEYLRILRTHAGLTQEELAAAASLSPRAISDLERSIHPTARRETARLLADALNLTGPARMEFEAAARGRSARTAVPARGAASATRTLPRDTGAFTGRKRELQKLVAAASEVTEAGQIVGIHAIDGMAGIGKTAFAIHAAHQLAPRFPDGQIYLSFRAYAPGQRPVEPADALASLLLTAGISASQIPAGTEERARLWRDYLAGKHVLLLLDDVAGYDQIRPLLPGTPGSLVLITSRRHLTALEDARTISLDTLPADDAADLLVRLADRRLDAQDPAVRKITELCGYLPLAIAILARQLHHHAAWTTTQLASDVDAARNRLTLMRAENVSVGLAFDLSYQDLGLAEQRLFRRLALHPGADIDAHAAAALDGSELDATRRRLEVLYDYHLLTEHARGRYRQHDLIRVHARSLVANEAVSDREAATDRLADYYLRTASAADAYLARRARQPATVPARETPTGPQLISRADAMAWMTSERANLHAIVGLAANSGGSDVAMALSASMHAFLRFTGHWDEALDLHASALDLAVLAGDPLGEALALADLGDTQIARRDYPAAKAHLTRAVTLFRDQGDRAGEAGALTDLAAAHYLTGDNLGATAALFEALTLYAAADDSLGEALARSRLGNVQLAMGEYEAATASLTASLALYRSLDDRLGAAQALTELGAVQQRTGDYAAAAADIEHALSLYRELGDVSGEAAALLDLAYGQQSTSDHAAAAATLTRALALFESLGDLFGRANALSLLGEIEYAAGDYAAAEVSELKALELYRHLGDTAGEAEALLCLADVDLAGASPDSARPHFERALEIARANASPLPEARALEGIGRCLLRAGQLPDALGALRQALAIHRRLGSPAAQRIESLLDAAGKSAV